MQSPFLNPIAIYKERPIVAVTGFDAGTLALHSIKQGPQRIEFCRHLKPES